MIPMSVGIAHDDQALKPVTSGGVVVHDLLDQVVVEAGDGVRVVERQRGALGVRPVGAEHDAVVGDVLTTSSTSSSQNGATQKWRSSVSSGSSAKYPGFW